MAPEAIASPPARYGMARQVEYPAEEVLEKCFTGRPDKCEPRNAREVAEIVGCSEHTAREKLRILVDHGELRSKRLGSYVFWRPCFTEDV